MKKAFTLAEIMIVLTIIGVLTAILMPVAFQSSPDKNVMRFQKININLVTSEKYYSGGDLGLIAKVKKEIDSSSGIEEAEIEYTEITGNAAWHKTYFCKTMEDVLNVKKTNCINANISGTNGWIEYSQSADGTSEDHIEDELDKECAKATNDKISHLVLSDGAVVYETRTDVTFGKLDTDGNKFFHKINDKRMYYRYKVYCVDIDGIGKGEAPFGYAIRADGRMLAGKRAQEWSNKSVHKGN